MPACDAENSNLRKNLIVENAQQQVQRRTNDVTMTSDVTCTPRANSPPVNSVSGPGLWRPASPACRAAEMQPLTQPIVYFEVL